MHNLGHVFRFETTRTLKKKTFWIATLAMPIMIAVLFGLIFLSNKSGSEQIDKMSSEAVQNVAVNDHSGYVTADFAKTYNLQLTGDDEAAIDGVQNGRLDMFVIFPNDPATDKMTIYAKDDGVFGNSKYQTYAAVLMKSAVAASVGDDRSVAILTNPNIGADVTTYKEGMVVAGLERYIAPLIFLVILYLVIILLSNQMLTSTTEEKENRVTEIILTTIKPGALIMGKILALLTLGVIQILMIALPTAAALLVFRQDLSAMIPKLDWSIVFAIHPQQFLIGLGFLLGGLLLYTGVLVAIGAAVPTAKDANSFFGVAVVAMMAPLYTIALILTDPNQPIVQFFSYFPLSAPVAMMIRNAFGSLELWQAILGLTIVFVSAVFVLTLAAKIFRYGTLEYSRRLSLREIFSKKARA